MILTVGHQHDNRDDEFLGSRLLFLCTYDTKLDFDELFANNDLADSIDNVSGSSLGTKT